jgi:hypothetical protein
VSESADFQKGLTAAQSGDYATALREWEPLAKQGDADAQYYLGVMDANGQGVPQDYKTAVKWFKLAAEQGNAYAQAVPEIPKKHSEVAMGECPKGTIQEMQLGTCTPESSDLQKGVQAIDLIQSKINSLISNEKKLVAIISQLQQL